QSTGGYFRAHARNEAHFNRKLCGALKELGRGQTEIIVEGKTSAIRSFLRWCKKGPGEGGDESVDETGAAEKKA
ncbi:unnamed protein product, partial [Hapterophycus canaliculatus]